MKERIGRLAILFVAMLWGAGYVGGALALEDLMPLQVMALRFTLAFAVSLVVFYPRLKTMTASTFWKCLLVGALLFLAFYFQTIGLKYTTASKNAFLTSLSILIVPLLIRLVLKLPLSKYVFIGALVALGGIAALSWTGEDSAGAFNRGDFYTLLCALFFALQLFYADYFLKNVSAGVLMTVQMGVAMVLSWLALFASGEWSITLTEQSTWAVLYLGLGSALAGFAILSWAQRLVPLEQSALILSLESFFGMLGSVLVLGEPLSPQLLLGGGLILAGLLIVEIGPRYDKNYNELMMNQ